MRPVINLLKRIGPLRVYVQDRRRKRLLNRRLAEVRSAIDLTFRGHLNADAVAEDFAFSLKITDRQCCQVLLIEDALLMLARQHINGALVECGVFTGGASGYMLRSALRNNNGELPDYWGFDSFQGMPHASKEDGKQGVEWLVGEDQSLSLDMAQDGKLESTAANKAELASVRTYLQESGYPATKLSLIPGWFQDTLPEAAGRIGPIALLRLDSDFYASTKTCLDWLAGQVVPGGIIILDDYGSFEGCRMATDEWVASQTSFSLPIRYDNYQAFIVRTPAAA